jgi:MFS family permease
MKNSYIGLPLTIWLLSTVTLISRSGSMVLVFMPLYLTHQLHFSITNTGTVLSFYGLGEIVGSYLGGAIADRIGYLRIQTICLLLTGLLYLTLLSLHSPISIRAFLFLIGLLIAGIRPATSANLASFSTIEIRARAYALNYQALNLGFCIGSSLGGLLVTFNYSWLFIVDGFANIAAAIAFWSFFRKKKEVVAQPLQNSYIPTNISPWRNKPFLFLLCLVLLIGMCFFLTSNVYPLYLKEHYYLSPAQIGMIFALNGVMILLFQMQITSWLKDFKSLQIIGIGGLIVAMGYVILPFYHGFYYATLSMALITIGEMIAIPFMYNYVIQIAPSNMRGKYQGLVSCALLSLPLAITPTVASYIYITMGADMLWYIVGSLGLVIFVGYNMLNKYTFIHQYDT